MERPRGAFRECQVPGSPELSFYRGDEIARRISRRKKTPSSPELSFYRGDEITRGVSRRKKTPRRQERKRSQGCLNRSVHLPAVQHPWLLSSPWLLGVSLLR